MIRRNRQTETDKFLVFSVRLAKYLENEGYEIRQTRPDLRGTGRNVFLFDNTPQLRQAVDTYMS